MTILNKWQNSLIKTSKRVLFNSQDQTQSEFCLNFVEELESSFNMKTYEKACI